ncbi:MAG: hypothetical protein HOC23_24985 [Halieaceae bacterium]|jgi:hypothetical protein|nr:hypothetical protein [Halieaceae bacterium]
MKTLTVYTLALLLVTGTTAALAGSRHHGGHHYKPRHHYSGGYSVYYGSSYRPHYVPQHWRRGHSRHYARGYYGPSYLGAALVGSALTASLVHSHGGVSCRDNHASGPSSGSYREVVGCYRIEQLADGGELRVDLPMSQCQ